jgi:hypothetical protein
MAKKAREPVPSRRDPVSSTECDRCPSDDHAVLGTGQQAYDPAVGPFFTMYAAQPHSQPVRRWDKSSRSLTTQHRAKMESGWRGTDGIQ